MATKTIFINGVTGYIGGMVLADLLKRPDISSYKIRALVRNKEKAEKLKELGVEPVLGELDDVDIIEKEASEADVVIATADCDHEPSAHAILRGAKKRFEATGKRPVFINTSGTGVLSDNARGLTTTDTIYDDSNVEQMASIPLTQIHRPVDVAIVDADTAGYVYTYIILPSTIYGWAKHDLVDRGIANYRSVQVPVLAAASLERRRAGMVGKGVSRWPSVEVHELGDLYNIIFGKATKDPESLGHGKNGYYFGASDEHSWYEISKAIGEALVKLGRADDPEPTSFTKEELEKYFAGSEYWGSNSRARANHSKSLGWNPKKTTKDLLASVEQEVRGCIEKPFKVPAGKEYPTH
ncbi:NAD(P)-binding protein [Schizophyllum commune Loenen D]|nr:NAD(P)-binding protein [Schizophyllum commune Loenen D]